MHIVDWRNRLYIFIHNLTKKKQTQSLELSANLKKGNILTLFQLTKQPTMLLLYDVICPYAKRRDYQPKHFSKYTYF